MRANKLIPLFMWGLSTAASGADTVNYGVAPSWVQSVTTPDPGTPGEAPAKVLSRNYQVRFTPGTSELYVESFVRVQTPEGLQALGNIALPWRPDTDQLTVHKYRLLRGERVIDILANGQKFEVLRRENNLEFAALDGLLTAAMQPAGMEVGDVLNLAFSLKREGGLISAPEMALYDFALTPVSRVELRAIWSADTPLRWRASQDVKGIKELRDGSSREISWTASDIEPLQQAQDVPGRFWRFPMVEFSTYSSWNDVSRTLAPLYAKAAVLEKGSPLAAEVKAIASASADPVDRMEAALRLAQERVRYVFLGMGDGNINPASADLTWERRFGDCKGKTALLIAILRDLGIDAEPVAVSVSGGDAIADRLPMLAAFDHVIVRARAGGKTWWLDGAGSSSWRRGALVTPNYHWGLPLTARGDTLLRMQAEPAAEPAMEVSTEIDASKGLYTDAPFKAEVRLRGPTAATLRTQLAQLTPANRDQGLRSYWKEEYNFVEPKNVTAEFDELSGVMVLSMEGTAVMDWGGFRYVADGMRTGERADYSRDVKINADAPFLVNHPTYVRRTQRIQLPGAGNFVRQGEDYDVKLAGYHHVRHSKILDRVFTGEVTMRSMVSEVSAKDARAAERQLNAMWNDRVELIASGYLVSEPDIAALRARKYTRRADLVWRGNLFLDRREYDAALADFEAAVQADARSADALAHRGLANFWKKQLKEARADFDAALAIDAEHPVALRGLGVSQRESRDCKAAIESFTKSLRKDPDNTFALSYRAYCYSELSELQRALDDASLAIRLSPAYLEMYDLRAWIYSLQGKTELVLTEVQTMLKAAGGNAQSQWFASHHYSRLGRYADAVRAMDVVVANEPSVANYLRRAQLRDPDDYDGRLADFDAALEKDPAASRIGAARASVLSESGKHRAALEAYDAVLKKAPASEKARLRIMLGIEHHELGDDASARRLLNAALGSAPDANLLNSYCWGLAKAQFDLESALSACEKAVALAPKRAAYLDSRGFVLLQLGRFDASVASYDAALAENPQLAPSLYGRGLAKSRRCGCADGDADMKAAMLAEPGVARTFTRAGLAPQERVP